MNPSLIDRIIRAIAAHYRIDEQYVHLMLRACSSIDEAIARIEARLSSAGDDIDLMSDCHLK